MPRNVIERKVRSVARLLNLWRTIQRVLWCEQFALAALLLLVLAQKLLYVPLPLLEIMAGGVAAAGIAGLLSGLRGRVGLSHAAVLIDESLGLKERTLTSICLSREAFSMVPALQRDAERALGAAPHRRIAPFHVPRSGYVVLALLVALCGASFLKQFDLLGRKAAEQRRADDQQQIQQAAKLLAQRTEQRKQQLEKAELTPLLELAKDMEIAADELLKKPPLEKREALEKLSNLADKIRDQREQLSALQALQQALGQLDSRPDTENPARPLEEALRQGDFGEAQRQLEALKEQLSSGQLTPEQMKKLSERLSALGSQIAAAANVDTLKKALANSNLAPQERQALEKQLQNAQQCAKCLSPFGLGLMDMAAALQGLGQSTGAMNLDGLNKSLSDISGALSELEQQALREQLLAAFESDLQQCKGSCSGMGRGQGNLPGAELWAEGDSSKWGQGFGKAGKGRGGIVPERPHETDTTATRLSGRLSEGKILSAWFTDGQQVKGEARREFSEAVSAAQQDAAQAVSVDRIPSEYQDQVKSYFEGLSEH